MPSPRMSPVTFPNKVRTPTLPVVIEVVLASSRITNSTTPNIFSKRLRKTAKAGIPPRSPKSIVRPVFVIGFSVRNRVCRLTRFAHLAAHPLPAMILRFALEPMHYGRFAIAREAHEKSTASATLPLYLVWFLLDTTRPSRNNPGILLLQAASRFLARRPLGGSACNTCRAGLSSASTRLVPREGIGCALIFPVLTQVWNFVRLAAAASRPCRHPSALGSA